MTGRSASLHSTYINGQTSLSCIYFQDLCFPFLFLVSSLFLGLPTHHMACMVQGRLSLKIPGECTRHPTKSTTHSPLLCSFFSSYTGVSYFLVLSYILGMGTDGFGFFSLGKNRHDQTLSRQGIVWYILLVPHHLFGSRRSTRAKHRVPSSRWACPKTATPCFTTGLDTITELLKEISHWNFAFLSLYSLLNVPCFLL